MPLRTSAVARTVIRPISGRGSSARVSSSPVSRQVESAKYPTVPRLTPATGMSAAWARCAASSRLPSPPTPTRTSNTWPSTCRCRWPPLPSPAPRRRWRAAPADPAAPGWDGRRCRASSPRPHADAHLLGGRPGPDRRRPVPRPIMGAGCDTIQPSVWAPPACSGRRPPAQTVSWSHRACVPALGQPVGDPGRRRGRRRRARRAWLRVEGRRGLLGADLVGRRSIHGPIIPGRTRRQATCSRSVTSTRR